MKKKYIAIVDPFIDTEHIVQGFGRRGIPCVAVLSEEKFIADAKDLIQLKRYNPALFDHQFFCGSGFEKVIKQLKELDLIGIITGWERGSILTDKLNEALKLPLSNPINSTLARFDKFVTNELAQSKGIATVKQIKITAEAIKNNLVNLDQFNFPVVIKPTQSGGSFGIYFCKDQRETIKTFTKLTSIKDNFFGKTHSEFVIQEQLLGTEFIVDVVNFRGIHYLCSVDVYHKRIIENRPLVQSASWVNPESNEAKIIVNYCNDILDAIDFNFGPAHIEIFLTADGPRLVEVNPRVSGASGYNNKMCKLITGLDQVDLLTDLYSGKIINSAVLQQKNGLNGTLICLCNLHYEEATINQDIIKQIKSIPSYQEIYLYDKPKFPKTVDLHTIAGFLLLANKNQQQLEQDYSAIVNLQDESLFQEKIIG